MRLVAQWVLVEVAHIWELSTLVWCTHHWLQCFCFEEQRLNPGEEVGHMKMFNVARLCHPCVWWEEWNFEMHCVLLLVLWNVTTFIPAG